jgi:hypothetical protein
MTRNIACMFSKHLCPPYGVYRSRCPARVIVACTLMATHQIADSSCLLNVPHYEGELATVSCQSRPSHSCAGVTRFGLGGPFPRKDALSKRVASPKVLEPLPHPLCLNSPYHFNHSLLLFLYNPGNQLVRDFKSGHTEVVYPPLDHSRAS